MSTTLEPHIDRPVAFYPDEVAQGGVSLGSAVTGALVTGAAAVAIALLARGAANYAGFRPLTFPVGGLRAPGLLNAFGVGAGLLLATLWGGYTAGRMARGKGWLNGALVVLAGAALLGIGALIAALAGSGPGFGVRLHMPAGYPRISLLIDRPLAELIVVLIALIGCTVGGGLGRRFHLRLERAALRRRQEAKEARDAFRDLREAPTEPMQASGAAPFDPGIPA